MASYDNKVLTGDQLVTLVGKIKSALAGKQDTLTFNTAYDATTNKAATMSDIPDVSGKQDALVFNTAYNATTNKVATMSDIPDVRGFIESSDIAPYIKIDDLDVNEYYDENSDSYDLSGNSKAQAVYDFIDTIYGTALWQDIVDTIAVINVEDTDDDLAVDTLTLSDLQTAIVTFLSAIFDAQYNDLTINDDNFRSNLVSYVQDHIALIDWKAEFPSVLQATNPGAAPELEDYDTGETDPDSGDPIYDQEAFDSAYSAWEVAKAEYDVVAAINSLIAAGITGKQDALVFNTAYNASSNKVATMSDIPDVSGFQTSSDVQTAITNAISGITSFSFQIVSTLPQSDISTSTIYLVLKSAGPSGNVYTEYAYINNNWEIIGDTQADISTLSTTDINTIWANTSAS